MPAIALSCTPLLALAGQRGVPRGVPRRVVRAFLPQGAPGAGDDRSVVLWHASRILSWSLIAI